MDVSTLFTALGFLLALIMCITGGVAWTNSQLDKVREQQIEDDKEVRKELTEYVDRLKAERDRTVDGLALTVASIKDSAATRQEMNLTENRLTTAISDLKIDNRTQFGRIDDKLNQLVEMRGTIEAVSKMLRSSLNAKGQD